LRISAVDSFLSIGGRKRSVVARGGAREELRLTVEGNVETELFLDEFDLVVGPSRSNDLESLPLGELTDDLANGSSCSRDEDRFALLWLPDGVERPVGGLAWRGFGPVRLKRGVFVEKGGA